MARKPLLAANWKMAQENWASASSFLDILQKLPKETWSDVDVVICPSYLHLGAILSPNSQLATRNSQLYYWGSQDIHYEKKGAYTGCVSAGELANLGARYVILGHSERRRYFKEQGEILQKKLTLAQDYGLMPIFCVGETKEERESGQTLHILKIQLQDAWVALEKRLKDPKDLVIAYEPVWAIGTGLVATPKQAQEAHFFIRDFLAKTFGDSMARDIRIVYGGSVTPDNFDSVARELDVDGALVGGASLKAESFARLLEILRDVKSLAIRRQ